MKLNEVKKQFVRWLSTHEGVLDEYHAFWYLQNFIGDLVNWEDGAYNWLTPTQRKRMEAGSQVKVKIYIDEETVKEAAGKETRQSSQRISKKTRRPMRYLRGRR